MDGVQPASPPPSFTSQVYCVESEGLSAKSLRSLRSAAEGASLRLGRPCAAAGAGDAPSCWESAAFPPPGGAPSDGTASAASPSPAGADADAALQEGKDALEVLRRQRIVGQLYPAAQSVMDAEASRAFEDAAESVIDPVGSAGR